MAKINDSPEMIVAARCIEEHLREHGLTGQYVLPRLLHVAPWTISNAVVRLTYDNHRLAETDNGKLFLLKD
jgi:hypothetical protein